METPICDFVKSYSKSNFLRLHMPGHKGSGFLGMEALDITEIDGADSLYEAHGIIKQSEDNASEIFGSDTFYSTEGSSHCIRAMLYLSYLYAQKIGRAPIIFAGRNVHKVFVSAVSMLDMDVEWLLPEYNSNYLSCPIDENVVEKALREAKELPAAVYLTNPDYLGKTVDIESISKVCKRYNVLLLVDNAHGAYLKFLNKSLHPIDLGADMCSDSAHKTLPVLTGGAYLHISESVSDILSHLAKDALSLFGSTSPSYIILQSLDMANKYICDGYREKLSLFADKVTELKDRIHNLGYSLYSDEPLKITIEAKPYGYDGRELAGLLAKRGIICEFSDGDFVTLMLTPEIGEEGLDKLFEAMRGIEKRESIFGTKCSLPLPSAVMSVREAVMSDSEVVDVNLSEGRILSSLTVGCPPAVPIVVCGEVITKQAIDLFLYYGIEKVSVVKQN